MRHYALTAARAEVLVLFSRQSAWTSYQLSIAVGRDPALITRQLRLMEYDGLIAARREKGGRRRLIYRLTPMGREAVPLAVQWLDILRRYRRENERA